jgi:hypothetical protein
MPYPTTFPSQDIMRVAAFMEGRGKDDKPLVLESAYTVLGFGLATLVPVHGQSGNGGPTPAPAPGPQPPQPGPPSPPPPPTGPGPRPPAPKAEQPKGEQPKADQPKGQPKAEQPKDAAAEAAARQQSSSPGSQAGPRQPPPPPAPQPPPPGAQPQPHKFKVEPPPHGEDKANVAADLRAWAHDEGEKLGRFGPMQAPSGRGEGFTHPEMRSSRQPVVSPSLGAEPKAGGAQQSPHQSPTYAGPQYKFSPPPWLVPLALSVLEEIIKDLAAK